MLAVLLRNDVRLVFRDRLLVMLLGVILALGAAARFALPALDASFARSDVLPEGMRFADLYPLLLAFLALWQGALIPGTVFGFLLLDEKEDDTLRALRVTPLPLERYLVYRVSLPAALALAFHLALVPLIGHATLDALRLIPIALTASMVAPITVLLLASFASNKVQGLAFTKFSGVAGLLLLIGFFVPGTAQWAFGLFPPFLVCKSYWMALEGEAVWWLPLLPAAAMQALAIAALTRRFRAIAFA